jgi:hypothetical protein
MASFFKIEAREVHVNLDRVNYIQGDAQRSELFSMEIKRYRWMKTRNEFLCSRSSSATGISLGHPAVHVGAYLCGW